MRIKLNNVRLAFPVLFQAKAGFDGEGEPAFSATFLLDPKAHAKELKEINAAIDKVASDKWAAKAEAALKGLRSSGKVCLKNGDEKSDYEGFEGNMFISARSKSRPLVIDRDKSPLVESDGRPYGGCYVNATIDLWAQDNQFGKRINAQVSGVQFVRDGDAFGGGRPASADDFETVDESEDSLA